MRVFLVLILAILAHAQDNNPLTKNFELDGNQKSSGGPDWDTIFPTPTQQPGTFLRLMDTGSEFTGGGSKDPLPTSSWLWDDGSVPQKNDLVNAYAVQRLAANGNVLVHFGGDIFSNDGAANLGLWFFVNQVAPKPDGTWSGSHSNGDFFLIVAYSQGGAVATASGYKWSNADPSNPLVPILNSTNAICKPGNPQTACVIVNSKDFEGMFVRYPADKIPVRSTQYTIGANSFFEGAVNLDALFPDRPCFSTFLMETRSSPSSDSTLQDFVVGDFRICGIDVNFVCNQIGYLSGSYSTKATVEVKLTGGSNFPVTIQPINADGSIDSRAAPIQTTMSAGTKSFDLSYTLTNGNEFTAYVKVSIPGTSISAVTKSDVCEAPPSFSVASACNVAAVPFRPNGVPGFGYEAVVTVTNTNGGAKSCSLVPAPGAPAITQDVPAGGSSDFKFSFSTTTNGPQIPSMTVECSEGAFFRMSKPVPQPDAAHQCKRYTHDYSAAKQCTAGTGGFPKIDGDAVTTDGWAYALEATVNNRGDGKLYCTFAQPTTGYTVTSSTPSLLANLELNPQGSSGDSASINLQVHQKPSQQDVLGTLKDTASTLSCQDAGGNAVSPTSSVGLTAASADADCQYPFRPSFDVTKDCKLKVAKINGILGLKVFATGTITNTGEYALRVTPADVSDDPDGPGSEAAHSPVSIFRNNGLTDEITDHAVIGPNGVIYFRDFYNAVNPTVSTQTGCSEEDAKCLSFTDVVSVKAIPEILYNDGVVSETVRAGAAVQDTQQCTSSPCQ